MQGSNKCKTPEGIVLSEMYNELKQSVIDGNQQGSKDLVNKLLAQGEEAKAIIDNALITAMDIVGDKFQNQEFFIPELLVAARAMEGCLAILQPLLAASDVNPAGIFVVGTVKGDLHDIGKNIVAAMMKGAGFEVIDLGVDNEPAKFINAVKERNANVIGLSALLTTTMKSMKDTIEALKEQGLRDKVKVIIGGAPITEDFAKSIGADGYAPDAALAVKKAKELLAV